MEKTALKIGPPPSPNRDVFPFVGTADVQGLKIDIENLAGSIREGTEPNGKKWRTKMRYHYGEIRKTKGTDRDKLDVYIGPNPQSKKVFIVHQNHPGGRPKAGQYDEDKVMLGFNSAEEAKRGYLKQYDRKDFFRSMTEMNMSQFKKSIFGENKGEKIAAGPSDIELEFEPPPHTRSPAEQARLFYTKGGGYLTATDPEDFKRQQVRRNLMWEHNPELKQKWVDYFSKMSAAKKDDTECKTPGEKIRSKGMGRGKAVGKGKGPIGVPLKEKLRAFAKTRKKDKQPSTFIREKMKVGSLQEAYTLGVKTALAQAMNMQLPAPTLAGTGPLAGAQPPPPGGSIKAPSLSSAPAPASEGTSDGTTSA